MKNPLFDEKRIKAQASELTPPRSEKTGLPMQKVIVGSFGKKKLWSWFDPSTKTVLPIFKPESHE